MEKFHHSRHPTGFVSYLTLDFLTRGGWKDLDILWHQTTAPGRITANPDDTIDFAYEFTVNGKKYTSTDHVSPNDLAPRVEEMVNVYYSTQNPFHSRLTPPPNFFPAIGIYWSIVLLAFIVDRRDRAKKEKRQAAAR